LCRVAKWLVFIPNPPEFGTFWTPVLTENFDIFYDHLVYFVSILIYFMAIWYTFGNSLKYPHFGILCQEQSGNPGLDKNLGDGLDGHEAVVREPVVAGLDARAVDEHLRVCGQAGKRAPQMLVHLREKPRF
jgi:hypothetical protein